MATNNNGNGIGNAVIDPAAEDISSDPVQVTSQQENKFFEAGSLQHKIDLQKLELGFLGQFFGSGAKAGTNIAGFTAGIAFLLLAVTFFKEMQEVATVRSALTSIITSALGYIFGASRKD